MEKVHESIYQIINYYPEKSIIECIWQNTENMKPEDFQQGLRKQEELSIPELQGESGLWLNDSQTKLNVTFYLKYSNNHNYQINIPNKLRIIERLFLDNKNEFGQINAITC